MRYMSSYPQTTVASDTHSPFRSLPRNTQPAPQSVFPSTLPSQTQYTTTTGTHARLLLAVLPHRLRSSHKERRPSASGLPNTTVGYTPQGCSALTSSNQPASKAALIATKSSHSVTQGGMSRHENLCEDRPEATAPTPPPNSSDPDPLLMLL